MFPETPDAYAISIRLPALLRGPKILPLFQYKYLASQTNGQKLV